MQPHRSRSVKAFSTRGLYPGDQDDMASPLYDTEKMIAATCSLSGTCLLLKGDLFKAVFKKGTLSSGAGGWAPGCSIGIVYN
jgi:hypothetical protein